MQGKSTITLLDGNFQPVWPQMLNLPDGRRVAVEFAHFRINERRFDRASSRWVSANADDAL